ncbi:efflux transporter outer membrane subunit [Calidifontimicrobium sp. SYSU G02091]|uniref:efflux transporter outer membrane subunit n=1 Tax=Calidifontimicrobium sp. SYSU G02091 TaxID=2926421 RepID=UPI001F53B98B|nr:efflux transporter outer membrane subunit [Calidifontimicrobium sp. SYSU G02091]MCI1190713.1 efflux transporter outer membrane subunit [Calidifontimicrobium sp. SYSU G02091]
MTRVRAVAAIALAAAVLLAGCAAPRPPVATAEAPGRWHALLPAEPAAGDAAPRADLARWWQQFDDPRLAALVAEAQASSPTLAAAAARIAQARAARAGVDARAWPALDANASALRGRPDLASPTATRLGAELRASWELDLFGRLDAADDAARARVDATRADWHAARVALAAEVGTSYVALRACEALLDPLRADARSREETARLATLAAEAGFRAPAAADLARASAAQARFQAEAQQQRCELELKALVALTGADEARLRDALAEGRARVPRPAAIAVDRVPAQALAPRPDRAAAAQRVAAAAAEVGQADAERYPRVTLAGAVGPARLDAGALATQGTTWSLGPLQVTLPVFDAGARAAGVDAARARYDEARAQYAAALRQAVREVESALVTLQGTAARALDAQRASDGYEASLRATEGLYRGGLASLFELEDARRTALAARRDVVELERERVTAWISLYRALGGGWTPTDDAPTVAPSASDDGTAVARPSR